MRPGCFPSAVLELSSLILLPSLGEDTSWAYLKARESVPALRGIGAGTGDFEIGAVGGWVELVAQIVLAHRRERERVDYVRSEGAKQEAGDVVHEVGVLGFADL